MEAKQYTISEAAKKLHVGSHVLRFWEEELHLNIPRNEMGHRVYSEKEMKQLEQIINMKKNGFSLKDIEHKLSPKSSGQVIPYPVSESEISPNDKMIQFKTILSRIVSDAIRENSDSLTSDIADTVSVQVNKELDYLFRENHGEGLFSVCGFHRLSSYDITADIRGGPDRADYGRSKRTLGIRG